MTQDQKLDLLLEKFDVMSGQMGSIDNRLTTLEGRVDALDKKVTTLDNRVTALNKKVDKHYQELKSMDKAIFDEVERVHHILMRHQADKKVHTA